jgi:suppressor of ftsI/bilirubin oxidase
MNETRRNVLIASAGVGALALAGGAAWWYLRLGAPYTPGAPAGDAGLFVNPLLVPGASGPLGVVEVTGPLAMSARSAQFPILKDKPGRVLTYQVAQDGKSFVNPILRVQSGAEVSLRLQNALDEPTIVHWHGLKVDARNDAHPQFQVAAGAAYEYKFAVANRAGTYWYHPHPHRLTSKQAYLGLASFLIVEDDEEKALQKALDLEFGASDIPLVIQDKNFDAQGVLAYTPDDEQKVNGYVGSELLVNLTPRPRFEAATRIYRFRILNGSNARIYRLAFAKGGEPLEVQVVATDGGLLESAVKVREAFLSPGERVEVLLDLRSARVGDTVWLKSLAFDPMHLEAPMEHGAQGGHGGHAGMGGMAGASLADGAASDLLRIDVARKVAYDRQVPAVLSRLAPPPAAAGDARKFVLERADERWRINGLTFEMDKAPITVRRGAKEIWEIRNGARSMPHPMHVHGFNFRVLERRGSPAQQEPLALNAQGLAATDLGWKDTVLLWPGETVRLALDFSHSWPGDQTFLFHCHNLEHEDEGMMINFKVQA